MSERQKQREFVKSMVHFEGDRDLLETWQNRMQEAEREERCVASSLRLVFLIFLLAISGLGYCRLFLTGSMTHSPQLLIKVFFALVVACGFCFMCFGCLWLYYRQTTDRVCAEGRQRLISIAQCRSDQITFTQTEYAPAPRRETFTLSRNPACAEELVEVA